MRSRLMSRSAARAVHRAAGRAGGSGCGPGSDAGHLDRPERHGPASAAPAGAQRRCSLARPGPAAGGLAGAGAPRRHGRRADRDPKGPLDTAGRGEPGLEVLHDHARLRRAAAALRSKFGRMRPVLPAVSFPCLSFTWELVAPSGYEAVDCGPGLVAADGEASVDWAPGGLELWRRGWELVRGAQSRPDDQVLSVLDERLDAVERRGADVRGVVCPVGFGAACRDRRPPRAGQGGLRAEVGVHSEPSDDEGREASRLRRSSSMAWGW